MTKEEAWEEFQRAHYEVDYLRGIINGLLASLPKEKAEVMIIERYIDPIDQALKRLKIAFDSWFSEVKKELMNK